MCWIFSNVAHHNRWFLQRHCQMTDLNLKFTHSFYIFLWMVFDVRFIMNKFRFYEDECNLSIFMTIIGVNMDKDEVKYFIFCNFFGIFMILRWNLRFGQAFMNYVNILTLFLFCTFSKTANAWSVNLKQFQNFMKIHRVSFKTSHDLRFYIRAE